MSTYHVKLANGSEYNIDAANDAQASAAVDSLTHNQAPQPQSSALEAAARGAGNNFPLLPQAIAGLSSGKYSDNLADWKAKAAGAKADHPIAYGAGAVAGAAAPLLIPGVGEALEAAPVLGNAVYGAASAISDDDLSQDPMGALKDAAIGGVTGGAVGGIGKAISGATDTVAPYVKEFGQGQALKSQGITRGMVGKLGPEESLQVGQELIDRGIVSPTVGQRGARQMVSDLADDAGSTIGAVRGAAGQAPGRDEVLKMLMDQYGDKYTAPGLYSGEASTFTNAINEIKKLPEQPTFQQWADKASLLNKFASDASGLQRSANAESDIADALSNLNDTALNKNVSPETWGTYDKAKATFGAMKPIQQIQAKGLGREIASRGGATMGTKAFEKAYEGPLQKAVAVGASKVGDALNSKGLQTGLSAGTLNTTAGVTSTIMSALQTNPQSLGKYAKPLVQAAQGGPQGIAATHYVLSTTDPAYNEMWQKHAKQQ